MTAAQGQRGNTMQRTIQNSLRLALLGAIVVTTSAHALSGRVYRDYDRDATNDTLEPGIGGITVTAYGLANTACGSATTASSGTPATIGTYSFTPTATGNCAVATYRVEFTGSPSFLNPTSAGTSSVASSVQFAAGAATGVNYGIASGGDYCVPNGAAASLPRLVTPLWRPGPANNTDQAVRDFPYDRNGNTVADTEVANFQEVGAVMGTGYDRVQRRVFLAAYFRRHVGPLRTGVAPTLTPEIDRIYSVARDAAGTGWNAPIVYAEIAAGTDPRTSSTYDYLIDFIDTTAANNTWDRVGKVGWGDVDVSEDGQSLYAINFADRSLWRMPAQQTAGLPLTTASAGVTSTAIPNPCQALTGVSAAAANTDFRPGALAVYNGAVYVGGVCSGQSSTTTGTFTPPAVNGTRTLLYAWVTRFVPGVGFDASPTLSFRLDYPRNDTDPDPASNSAEWQPWTTTQASTPMRAGSQTYPMPMFGDIEFDRGDMIIALRDRFGDLSTTFANNPTTNGGQIRGIPGGELLRACLQTTGTYTLESNGTCAGVNGSVTGAAGTAANGARGPGSTAQGGEYYPLDHFVNGNPGPAVDAVNFDGVPHDEVATGALAQVPGFPQVVATMFDPFDEFDSAGVRWINNSNPASNSAANFRGYEVFDTGGTFKSNGNGDLEAMCDAAPIQLGNRLFLDTDADGIQDPDEAGIPGYEVILFNAAGAQIGRTVTDANGLWQFNLSLVTAADGNTNDNNVLLTAANFYGTTVYVALQGSGASTPLTTANVDAPSISDDDLRDSDATLVDIPGAEPTRVAITHVLGNQGASDHTLDIGLTAVQFDWGDAPDTGAGTGPGNYQTNSSDNGPRHHTSTLLRLATIADRESNGQPGASANGDGGDEDGVTNTAGTISFTGSTNLNSFGVNVFNSNGAAATLCGYFDFNGDGDFLDSFPIGGGGTLNEFAQANVPDGTNGTINLDFLTGTAVNQRLGASYARFRLFDSTAANICSSVGIDGTGGTTVRTGEVEDYAVTAPNADIAVTKDDGVTTYTPGQSLTYTIVVTNNSTATTLALGDFVSDTNFRDVFPDFFARADWNEVVAARTGGGECITGCSGSVSSNNNLTPGTLNARLYLPPGATVTFRVVAIVRTIATGPLTNTAEVSQKPSTPGDVVPNNTSPDTDNPAGAPPPGNFVPICAQPGKDAPGSGGNPSLAANTVVNTYHLPTTTASVTVAAGSQCLPLTTTGRQGAAVTISAGDLLLVIQMQQGTFNSTEGADYGDGPGGSAGAGATNYLNAGAYEFVQADGALGSGIEGCTANEVPITGGGANFGLINAYTYNTATNARFQIVRVPQYAALALTTNNIVAFPWNGSVGGVTAVDVRDTLDLGAANGGNEICSSAQGFRGGGRNANVADNAGAELFRSALANSHGVKGEGLVGTPGLLHDGAAVITATSNYTNGDARRGAPGNAGGGGRSCVVPNLNGETGGGGGGNGGAGGVGGTDEAECTGDQPGGVGGAAFPTANITRLTMGGGGGGGAVDDGGGAATATSGGLGGGITIVRANAITGTGTLCANGGAAPAVEDDTDRGGGGGGAGGTVVLFTNIAGPNNYAGVTLTASGGAGATDTNTDNDQGAGGGGGGGRAFLAQLLGTGPTPNVAGGAAGVVAGGPTPPPAAGAAGLSVTGIDAYNVTPGAKPGYLCSTGTVPVTLSAVEPRVQGGELVVRFTSASEAGTLGYRVHADIAQNSARTLLNPALTVGKGESLEPQQYEVRGPYQGQEQVWIEELAGDGASAFYGPYPVGRAVGETQLTVATDWAGIRAEQAAFRNAQRAQILRSHGNASEVEIRVDRDGWYRVRHEDLLALGIDWSGQDARRLRLERGLDAIPLLLDGNLAPGRDLAFYGQAVRDSLYTRTAVYRLRLASDAQAGLAGSFAGAGRSNARSTVADTVVIESDRLYSFSAPGRDPFYWASVTRQGNATAVWQENFTLNRLAADAGEARVRLKLWGGLDFPDAPDHAVVVKINGLVVAQDIFDGITERVLSGTVPPGLLREGSNQIAVELPASTGLAVDRVNIESLEIDVQRQLALDAEGRLSFTLPASFGEGAVTVGDAVFASDFSEEGSALCGNQEQGCQAYAVANVAAGYSLTQIRDGQVWPLSGARLDGSTLRFAVRGKPGDRILLQAAPTAASLSLAPPLIDPLPAGQAQLLLLAHPSFIPHLGSLVAARQAEGFSVGIVDVEAAYRFYGDGRVDPLALSRLVAEAYRSRGTRYVILVGGDTYDYFNHTGANSLSFVPTFYRRTSPFVNYGPADSVYADADGDGLSDLAVGRLPVRTAAELNALVGKILAYPNAPHAGRALFLSDRDQNNFSFRDVSEDMAALLGGGFNSDELALQNYPAGSAPSMRGDVVQRLNQGRALLSFIGHSAPASWTREGLITAPQVYGGLLGNAAVPTAAVQWGCWATYFVEPRYNTVAHGLLVQGTGAAAILGATGLTEVPSDVALSNALLPALGQGIRIGDALRDAQRRLRSERPDAVDVGIGSTLLGDPTLRIRR